MLLPLDQLSQGLSHSERDVRDAVAVLFSKSMCNDPVAMMQVIQCIEELGWEGAFSKYHFLPGLLQTESTVDWSISRLESSQPFSSEAVANGCAYLASSLARSDPGLLAERRSLLASIPSFDQARLDVIDRRIELALLPSSELWRRLESICRDGDPETNDPQEDSLHICDIVRALSRHGDRREDLVLAMLSDDGDEFWPPGLGVQLAGEFRLQAAIPQLVAMLNDDDVWVFEECRPALVNIGSDEVVRRLGRRCRNADCDYRNLAYSVLAKIYSEYSGTTRLELAHLTTERYERGGLLASTLKHFASESVEPARTFVLEAPLDEPGLDVRKCLLTACQLLDCRFPEFSDWLDDSRNDEEYRQRWISQRNDRLGIVPRERTRAAGALLGELCISSLR